MESGTGLPAHEESRDHCPPNFRHAGILFFVFRDPAKRAEMAAALSRANSLWLFAGVAIYGVAEIVGCIRWQILLRVQASSLAGAAHSPSR
jgi:hypothetical protein